MRITDDEGKEIGYKAFTFPDGQRHIKLDELPDPNSAVDIETSLCSVNDLFDLLLVKDVLDRVPCISFLVIDYMLGARMDRPIDATQPCTLEVIADMINMAGFGNVTILDPHSEKTLDLLHAKAFYPTDATRAMLDHFSPADTLIIVPDKGAVHRVSIMIRNTKFDIEVNPKAQAPVQCFKTRDSQTGKLSGFKIEYPETVKDMRCIIIDDICDGGGTFAGLAKELRAAGAKEIILFVTHGIFSRGPKIEGIDQIFTAHTIPVSKEYVPRVLV